MEDLWLIMKSEALQDLIYTSEIFSRCGLHVYKSKVYDSKIIQVQFNKAY
ncbi:hypothetical protein Fmac_014010 [Flemingia macrophylla]|uniref:Uncharacterized protein n=1 Tax=Flemingia macrophylla TaxID=520843 RepID=A0ABD1MAM5_9FABA